LDKISANMSTFGENDKLQSKIVSTLNEIEDSYYPAFHGKLIYEFISSSVRIYVQ